MSTEGAVKKSILEQMIAISSLIFAVALIAIIAIPQMLQALFRLIYCQRKDDVGGKLAIVRLKVLFFFFFLLLAIIFIETFLINFAKGDGRRKRPGTKPLSRARRAWL
jgi:hypothetical protein